MRRVLVEEEQKADRQRSLPEVEQQEEQKAVQTPSPVTQKTARSGKPLRWAILVFGSIGAFALLVPLATGVPMEEWLKGADFKAAYSGKNFAFMRGMAALKTGNLAAATDAVAALEENSNEGRELASALFPKLLDAKDYERAARVSGYLAHEGNSEATPLALGRVLGNERGLQGALEFLNQNADGKRNRSLILPGVFTEVAPKELPALEKFASTLTGPELISAVQAIVQAHLTAEHFDNAWNWSEKLPEASLDSMRSTIITQEMRVSVPGAVRHLEALKPSLMNNTLMHSMTIQLMRQDLPSAYRVAAKISDEALKKSVLQSLDNQARQQEAVKQQLAKADALEASKRPEALIGLVMQGGGSEFSQKEILPRLVTLAKNNPEAAHLHDDLIRYLIVMDSNQAQRQKFLSMMLNPQTRAALAEELETQTTIKAVLKWGGGQSSASGTGKILTPTTGQGR
ncbi:MAG: hypothetical protein QM758_27315 [Armatimonas sp.]